MDFNVTPQALALLGKTAWVTSLARRVARRAAFLNEMYTMKLSQLAEMSSYSAWNSYTIERRVLNKDVTKTNSE